MKKDIELAVVVPAYNEERHIGSLLIDWKRIFDQLRISHQFIVINDGSTDGTADLLATMANRITGVITITQQNKGHGPSLWKGYHLALEAEWIFQVDGDHQFETELFEKLWSNKDNYDLLIGERKIQNASIGRRLISLTCRVLVHALYGKKIKDVNSPYRLIRSACLKEAMTKIRENHFTPNVMISCFFMIRKLRILTADLQPKKNAMIKKSKMSPPIIKGSLKSVLPIILLRSKL